jgi:hypothetical protein
MTTAKTAFNTAAKAYAKNPSATNYRALTAAALDVQAAHQVERAAKAYAKVISQSNAK